MSKARIVQFALTKKSNGAGKKTLFTTLLKRALNTREGGASYGKPDRFSRARFLEKKIYRSRAAFKLIDLEQRFALCRGRRRILDLGAAPGSWTQVAAEAAPEAVVLAVDKKPIEPFLEPRIRTLCCDLLNPDDAAALHARVLENLGGKAELLLCDVAPNTVGLSRLDNTRFAIVVAEILPIVDATLEEGGDWVVKMRHSAEEADLWTQVKKKFTKVQAVRSVASKRSANEIYWVARGFRKNDNP